MNLKINSRGFSYLGLLILLVILSITTAASLQLGAIMTRRSAEQELLAIGQEFRDALSSYAAATPDGQPSAPQSLQDLLKDPRFPNVRRHLRKLYTDPITGKDEWGTVTVASPLASESRVLGAGIVGIYSLSTLTPVKLGNFDAPFQSFEGKTSYTEWQFMPAASQIAGQVAIPTTPAPTKPVKPNNQAATPTPTLRPIVPAKRN
ncbi:type II secretion system protein [Undibacterium parvum]|uniref:Type II secretion system protein n=3 Tax=Undibacterium TaxID=401469 RepID=A0A6M4ABZ8_9BURK|nr:type II secretion system protein [Undibacterium parvum]QJQ07847.1 type II secretion system protein [Undibacterium piscinae]